MAKDLIFDIHKFSLNDGPGIRTTVFLKGCPLRCAWCHNPESQSFEPEISYNPDKCINCLECVEACPSNAHTALQGAHVFNRELCALEGECVKVCSTGALKIIGYKEKIENILIDVIKDYSYFIKSGGGLTVSGGEPMAQFEFTRELLRAARQKGLHTCLDTCGMAKTRFYEEILPYVDLFLFDYKCTDPVQHKTLTGAGNSLILENLDFIYRNGAQIILRCPVIPGINDTAEHFGGIISMMQKYPGLKEVQLMPYHSMGRSKAEQISREYQLADIRDANEDDKKKWTGFFNDRNFEVKCN